MHYGVRCFNSKTTITVFRCELLSQEFLESTRLTSHVIGIDGGGVRGLSSLLILKRIMYVLDQKVDRAVKRPLLPCDYFDMVAGTSTGG